MTGEFIYRNEAGEIIKTGLFALDAIIKTSVDRPLKTDKEYGTWSIPENLEAFMKENHINMVLSKLFNNIIVRWDKDIKNVRFNAS
jgi:hypothetical protein